MNTIRQEFCDETNTSIGLDNEFDYIRWLEAKIQALRIHDVVGRSEQLKAFVDFAEWYKDEYKQHIPIGAIKEYIKSL